MLEAEVQDGRHVEQECRPGEALLLGKPRQSHVEHHGKLPDFAHAHRVGVLHLLAVVAFLHTHFFQHVVFEDNCLVPALLALIVDFLNRVDLFNFNHN